MYKTKIPYHARFDTGTLHEKLYDWLFENTKGRFHISTGYGMAWFDKRKDRDAFSEWIRKEWPGSFDEAAVIKK